MFVCISFFFFFKQKTAYEMRISDWSSDVCSSDLQGGKGGSEARRLVRPIFRRVLGNAALDIAVLRHREPVAGIDGKGPAVGEIARQPPLQRVASEGADGTADAQQRTRQCHS